MLDAAPIALRARVILDNDYGGDPDGLFQLAHHLLCPSVDVRGIIASQHYEAGFYGLPGDPQAGARLANQLIEVMGLQDRASAIAGAPRSLVEGVAPEATEAARLIVREALRADAQPPLYVACGGGLTNLATAYLLEPAIAERVRLVWIGGPEHDGLALPPPGRKRIEYNLGIDPVAARIVFNDSAIPVWQVPRDAYRQVIASYAELETRVRPAGATGAFLMERLDDLLVRAKRSLGETYVLGDNPLVLLTALQTSWEVDPASSPSVRVPTPRIGAAGDYEPSTAARELRVFTRLDTRLLLEDFYAKLALQARVKSGAATTTP